MSEAIQEAPILCERPTAEELELVEWANDAYKKGLTTLQESFKQVITLDSALLAGSAVLFAQPSIHVAFKAIAAALLVSSLGTALWHGVPRETTIDIDCPDEVREFRNQYTKDRMRALRLAYGLLFGALATISVGGFVAALAATFKAVSAH